MNIVLLTNTFSPHVGGVARSVQAYKEEYLKRGHRVLVGCPGVSRCAGQRKYPRAVDPGRRFDTGARRLHRRAPGEV